MGWVGGKEREGRREEGRGGEDRQDGDQGTGSTLLFLNTLRLSALRNEW